MPRDVVVVGASAGGVEALRELVGGLPDDFPASVLVVLHVGPSATSALPQILSRASKLEAGHPADEDPLEHGRIYVAPPDRHLLVRDGLAILSRGPRENGHRPAVDPLFRSAARWHGPRTIAVVLSGTLDDGAAGCASVDSRGGRVLVQDPEDALYDGMPRAAIRAVRPHAVVPAAAMAEYLVQWTREDVPEDGAPADRTLVMETEMATHDDEAMDDPDRPGKPIALSCPDCGGAMFELDAGGVPRFRCRVGHAWSPDSLASRHIEQAEGSIWTAARSLEEKAALHCRLAEAATRRGNVASHRLHVQRAEEAAESANTIRQLLYLPTNLRDDGPLGA